MVRIQRESVINQEAYEKAGSMGIIYTHIAQTLARGYENLYYVNTETEEFIEYYTDPETEHYHEYSSSAGYRAFEVPADGEEFFASAKENGKKVVYPEDLEKYLSAFNKETVLFEIEQNEQHINISKHMCGIHSRS